MLMKKQFLSKAYGGVTVARNKLNGLGLPRQWKVITSTLLLLFTFAIGNVWADADYVLSIATATAWVDDKPSDGKATTFVSNGQTFTIAKGSTAGTAGKMGTNLNKLSKNATYTITLPTGFTANSINFKGYTNNGSSQGAIDKVNGSTLSDAFTFPTNTVADTEASWGDFSKTITGTTGTITFHITSSQQIGVIITISGTPAASGPVDPTINTTNGAYTINGTALDLTTCVSSNNTTGAFSFAVKTDGNTDASIDGSSFTANYAGTCVVTATQAAVSGTWNQKSVDFNVVVSAAAGKTDPTATFSNSDYTIGGTLDLSSLFESNSEGTVIYTITDAGTTSATLASDGKTFSATATGSATVKASQAATTAHNAIEKTATITVKAATPSCPDYGMIYKFQTKSSGLGTGNVCAATNTDYEMNVSNSLQTLEGGTLTARTSSTSQLKYNNNSFKFTGGSGGVLAVNMTCPIKAGDIIRYINSGAGSLYVRHTNSSTSTNQITLAGNGLSTIQTIVVPDQFADKKDLFIVRNSGDSYLEYFEVNHPYEITLNPVGGTITSTTIKAAGDDYIALPHPFKDSYAFAGWYNGENPVNDAYFVTGNVTLTAHYADCPTTGTLYSFQTKTGLADANIAAATGVLVNVNKVNYLSALQGGTMDVYYSGSAHAQIKNSAVYLNNNAAYIKVMMDCPIEEGDLFEWNIASSDMFISLTTTRDNSNTAPKMTSGEGSINVLSSNNFKSLIGKKEFYIFRNSSASISYFRISHATKYAVTYTAGAGSVKEGQSMPTQEATVEGGKFNTALGTALEKSGYDFAGWQWTDDESNTHNIAANTEFTMPAYPVTFVAQWTLHVDKYTVKYMDGEDLLDSEEVTVGEHPAGITNPTKALYTFANWKNGDDVVNPTELDGTADQVITLQAQWTKAYVPQGASYVFENTATLGTAPNAITVTKDNTKNSIAANSRIDNMWLSAMDVYLEDGTYDGGDNDFKGWKIKTASATIKFFVESDCRVTVTTGTLSSGMNIAYTNTSSEDQNATLVAKQANNYDVKGGTLVTLTTQGGNTVTLKGIAVSEIPALSDDATLKDLKVGGVTITGFATGTKSYYVEMPYGTAKADLPLVTVTTNEEHAVATVQDAKDRPDDTRATIHVVAQNGTTDDYYYVYFTIAPKYGVELIKATHNGTANGATVTGYIGGTVDKLTQTNGKLGSGAQDSSDPHHYFGIQLAEGTFKAGDMLVIKASALNGGNAATLYSDKGNTEIKIDGQFDTNSKMYVYTLEADVEKIYLYRQTSGCNPNVEYMAVYRLMAPFIESFEIAGVEDFVIDQDLKTITASVANTFDVTALTPTVKYWANGGGSIDKTGAQDFTNPVQYTVSSAYADDATGDYAPVTYTVTITKVVPSVEPTITTQPQGANYIEGASIAALTVAAESSAGTLSYQWQIKNGLEFEDIDGATAASYTPTVSAIGSYIYRVVVTNTEDSKPATSVNSEEATVEITSDPACATFVTIPTAEPYRYVNSGEWTLFNANSSGRRDDSNTFVNNAKDYENNTVNGFAKQRCAIIFDKDMKQVRFYTNNSSTGRNWASSNPVQVSADADKFLGIEEGNPTYTVYAASTSMEKYAESDYKIILKADGEFVAGKVYWFSFSNSVTIFQICAVEADPKAEAPVFSSTLSDEAICPGNSFATLDATASPVTSYAWYKDDEVIENAEAATYTPTEAGTYYCIATNSAAGYRSTSTKSAEAVLSVNEAASVTMANVSGKAAASIALNAVATGANPHYAWFTCDDAEGNNAVAIAGAADAASYAIPTPVATQYYKVVVTTDCGSVSAVALVTLLPDIIPLADVTESTVWDWSVVTKVADGSDLSGNGPTVTTGNGLVIANYLQGDKFDKIEGNNGAYSIRSSSNKFYQGASLHMHTTKGGILTIRARNEGHEMTLNVENEGRDIKLGNLGNWKNYTIYVKAGDVTIYNVPAEGTYPMRVEKITFTVKESPDYERPVSNNIGTLCVDHNVLVGGALGATFYQIASRNELYNDKIDFEEVLPNEELKAGEPYIFKSTTGKIELFYGETEADAPVAVRGMIGSFVDTQVDIDEENKSNILYIASNKLWNCEDLVGDHLEVVENRAYIVMSDVPTYAEYQAAQTSNPAPRRRVTLGKDAEQVVTGVENLNASEQPVKLLINGQIFILRGEKMFDATGRLVK